MRLPLALALLLAACSGSEGPAGPAGPAGSPGSAPALHLGAGLTGDGTAAQPLAVAYAGPGGAEACSRADHDHAAYLTPAALASYVTADALSPYVTRAAADAAYQPKGSYATTQALADYARTTDLPDLGPYATIAEVEGALQLCPQLDAGKLPVAYLPAAVPIVDGTGKLPAGVLPARGAVLRFQSSRMTQAKTLPAVPDTFMATLENAGDAAPDAPPVLWVSPGFTITTHGCDAALAPGETCSVSIRPDGAAVAGTVTGVLVASGGTGAVMGLVMTYE